MPPAKPASSTARKRLASDAFAQAAECLKILAHPHRLKIVHMLLEKRYTVGELAEACEIAHHMTSEHLRLMQRCGFLDSTKDKQRRYYHVIEPQPANIIQCVEQRFGT